ncbi:MAG: NAD-dependent epimerase/dehydratase family protein [Micromonosporaceae bacterium]
MRVVVIGGSGHVGTYLVPRLVALGAEVTVVSRGVREPYRRHGAWRRVTTVTADRDDPAFPDRIAGLAPDVVVDLICFTEQQARSLGEALRDRVRHLLHCGTIWVHGPSGVVPTTEDGPRRPIAEYGRAKAAIEAYLLDAAHRGDLPATVVHPGHIVGVGWTPVNPAGNVNPAVFAGIAAGEPLTLPNLGMETLQHVHADDVARVFCAAMAHRSVAVGESFHAVAPTAVTLRGYAEAVFGWFGHEPRLAYLPWEQWRETVDAADAEITYDHLAHSPHCGIDKARRLLGHHPRYTSLEAVAEAVDALDLRS